MAQLAFDTPVLRIEGLESKFDVVPVSSSLALLLGSELEAKIVQQLHFWTQQETSGILYKGAKWIYKSIREWILEVLPCWSTWQVRQAIASLVEKGVVVKEHLFGEHHGHNYHPQNRTLYYSIQYERLGELAQEANERGLGGFPHERLVQEKLKTIETDRFVNVHKTVLPNSIQQICESPQNNSNTTYKQNIQKETAIHTAAAQVKNSVEEKPKLKAKTPVTDIGQMGKEKGLKRVNLPEIESKPLSSPSKKQSELKKTNLVKDKKALRVDEKVNKEIPKITRIVNPEWRDHLHQLDNLGVAINQTIVSLVKLYKTDLVERALAVFRARKRESHIANPCGYFVQALKQNWGATTVATSSDSEDTVDTQAVFRHWYDLARELGYCSGQEVKDGVQWVNMNGSWETWEAAGGRGYSLDYLQGLLRRQNN